MQVVQLAHHQAPAAVLIVTLLWHLAWEYGAQELQGAQPEKPLPLRVQFAHQSMPYPSSYLKSFLVVFAAACSHFDTSNPASSLRAEAHQPHDLEKEPQSDVKILSSPSVLLGPASCFICRCTE